MINERELIRAAADGDRNAFEQVVTLYEKKIYHIAYKSLGNEQDALDVSQDVFLRVFRFLPGFKEESSFSTWIYRITMNLCKDYAKRRRIGMEVPLYGLDENEEPYAIDISDIRFNPENEYERIEMAQRLAQGIEDLPVHHKEVLLLREIAGKSYNDIGDILSLDVGTVKSRISRAREKLRELLSKDGTF